jgi:hypothetical protein
MTAPQAPSPEVESPQLPEVQFFGESLRLNPDVSEFALMEFAEAASEGQDGDTLEGMASLLRLVTEVIHPDDRKKFRTIARKNKAAATDLMKVLGTPVEDEAERPTVRSSDSSDGPVSIAPKSEPSAEDKVSLHLASRPDLVVAARRARKTA